MASVQQRLGDLLLPPCILVSQETQTREGGSGTDGCELSKVGSDQMDAQADGVCVGRHRGWRARDILILGPIASHWASSEAFCSGWRVRPTPDDRLSARSSERYQRAARTMASSSDPTPPPYAPSRDLQDTETGRLTWSLIARATVQAQTSPRPGLSSRTGSTTSCSSQSLFLPFNAFF